MTDFGKYWICEGCAALRGGTPFKTGNTVVYGTCAWCGGENQKEEFITPIRDFRWAKGRPEEDEKK